MNGYERILKYNISKELKGQKISGFLKCQRYPESSLTRLRHEEGAIRINDKIVHMNYRFFQENAEKEELTIRISERNLDEKIPAINLPLQIVYEDEDILVVNKPAFMPSHPSQGNYDNTLANAVAYYMKSKGQSIVYRCMNRLDRDTTGLTIIAKHYLAAGILSQDVALRKISRIYYGIVAGAEIDDCGTIDAPIARKEASTIERCVDFERGEKAITHFQVEKRFEDMALVRFRLETGRTHQIRVHTSYIGHPLIGDFLYNPTNKRMNRQALHAGELSFIHPVTAEKLMFKCGFPEDMSKVLGKSDLP